MSGDEEHYGNGPSTTVAEGFCWIRGSSWQPSDGPEIAIKVVLAWPIPIRRPHPCRRLTIGAGERLKVSC